MAFLGLGTFLIVWFGIVFSIAHFWGDIIAPFFNGLMWFAVGSVLLGLICGIIYAVFGDDTPEREHARKVLGGGLISMAGVIAFILGMTFVIKPFISWLSLLF